MIFIELLQVDEFIKQCLCFACSDLINFRFHLSIFNVDVIRWNHVDDESSDETTSISSFPDSLRGYSATHFCTEISLQSAVSELIVGTELHVSTSKSMYSSACIPSQSKSASSLKSALNTSLSISCSISRVSSVKPHFANSS